MKITHFGWLMTAGAILITWTGPRAGAEEYAPGGTADLSAAEAYETWMQFEVPDTHTPAIDTDGCLNYALAKLSVRYNLPVEGADLFTDSYTYYVNFSENILTPDMPKMQKLADIYSNYLTLEEPIWLSGDMTERMEQAYAICSQYENSREWCFILKMTTSSGCDHYVMTDYVNTEQHRLYLLDSGSWYIHYLGDEKTIEKGYYVTSVYPYHIQAVPGDIDGDLRLGTADAGLLLKQMHTLSTIDGDANHDGEVNSADAVYIARAVYAQTGQPAQYSIQSDGVLLPVATATKRVTKESSAPADAWFQKQICP